MISSENVPLNSGPSDEDFTVDVYRELLALAKGKYSFVSYDEIPWGGRFLLWRHDCDFSLNRAAALAQVEADEGVRATYFLNPHSDFYNIFERGQHRLVHKIIELGHRIGLHFDAAFHEMRDEECLAMHVRDEAALIEGLFGVNLVAFSFHNPLAPHLRCEDESYGGLVNCYSKRFKTEVPYCSDSNGYWRFRRLREVLTEGTDSCLQVLTHPDWWQETAMPPRQRIFRAAFGRARASMAGYDATLSALGRENLSGSAGNLVFMRDRLPGRYALLDYLWMSGEFAPLFIELWRLHERQISNLCQAAACKEWRVPAVEVTPFFEDRLLAIDGWRLFKAVFGTTWQEAAGMNVGDYKEWVVLRNSLIHGRSSAPGKQLEEGCIFLCSAIEALMAWGNSQPMAYDGISHLGSIGIPTYRTADGSLTDRLEEVADEVPNFPGKRWEQFKAEMRKVGAGGTVE